jgi:hypothetical protein
MRRREITGSVFDRDAITPAEPGKRGEAGFEIMESIYAFGMGVAVAAGMILCIETGTRICGSRGKPRAHA